MKKYIYQYFHSLPEVLEVVSKEEFLANLPVPDDLVFCDTCLTEIGTEVYLLAETKVFCKLCSSKYLLPYCRDTSTGEEVLK